MEDSIQKIKRKVKKMDKKTFLNRMANNIEIIESHIGYIESIFLTKDYAQIISEKVNLKYNFSENTIHFST